MTDITKFVPTPEPKILPEGLRNPGPFDDDYPIPQDAAKGMKLRAEWLTWWTVQTVGQLANPADEKAKAALTAVAAYKSAATTRDSRFLDAAVEGTRQALIAETADPMTRFFAYPWHGVHGQANKGSIKEVRSFVDPILAGNGSPAVKARVAWWAARAMEGPNGRETGGLTHAPGFYRQFWESYVELAKSRNRFDQDIAIELGRNVEEYYVTIGQKRPDGHAAVVKALDMAKVDPWVRQTVEGNYKFYHALDARKAGGPETEKLIKERIAAARVAFTAAYEANKEMPEAATMMLRVCVEEKAPREEMEAWFAKAMTADPDNFYACFYKMQFLMPTRDGSAKAMVAFGRQCLRTKNDVANLGSLLDDAHRFLARGKGDEYFAGEEPWADLREVYETRLKKFPTDRYARTKYAAICLAAGEGPGALHHLSTIVKNPWPGVFGDAESAYRRAAALAAEQGEKPD